MKLLSLEQILVDKLRPQRVVLVLVESECGVLIDIESRVFMGKGVGACSFDLAVAAERIKTSIRVSTFLAVPSHCIRRFVQMKWD